MEKESQRRKCPCDKDRLNSVAVEILVKTSEKFKDHLMDSLK